MGIELNNQGYHVVSDPGKVITATHFIRQGEVVGVVRHEHDFSGLPAELHPLGLQCIMQGHIGGDVRVPVEEFVEIPREDWDNLKAEIKASMERLDRGLILRAWDWIVGKLKLKINL